MRCVFLLIASLGAICAIGDDSKGLESVSVLLRRIESLEKRVSALESGGREPNGGMRDDSPKGQSDVDEIVLPEHWEFADESLPPSNPEVGKTYVYIPLMWWQRCWVRAVSNDWFLVRMEGKDVRFAVVSGFKFAESDELHVKSKWDAFYLYLGIKKTPWGQLHVYREVNVAAR